MNNLRDWPKGMCKAVFEFFDADGASAIMSSDMCGKIDAVDTELPEGRAAVKIRDLSGNGAGLLPVPP